MLSKSLLDLKWFTICSVTDNFGRQAEGVDPVWQRAEEWLVLLEKEASSVYLTYFPILTRRSLIEMFVGFRCLKDVRVLVSVESDVTDVWCR